MRKSYPISDLESFYNARKLQLDAKIVEQAQNDPRRQRRQSGTFESKITHSLYCLFEQVRDGTYNHNWKLRENGHAWLSYDEATHSVIYDTRRRNDDWSDSLIDNILERNSETRVSEWILFMDTPEYKENMETSCNYYELTGNYFSKIRTKYRETGIVSEYEYSRLTQNKYTKKVITAQRSEAKFAVGSLVSLRAQHEETEDVSGLRRCYKRDGTGNGILILSNSEPVVSACIGAKRYKAVMVGDIKPFYIEERFIKKKRKVKVNKS